MFSNQTEKSVDTFVPPFIPNILSPGSAGMGAAGGGGGGGGARGQSGHPDTQGDVRADSQSVSLCIVSKCTYRVSLKKAGFFLELVLSCLELEQLFQLDLKRI